MHVTYSVHFRKKVLSIKKKEGLSLDAVSKRFKLDSVVTKGNMYYNDVYYNI